MSEHRTFLASSGMLCVPKVVDKINKIIYGNLQKQYINDKLNNKYMYLLLTFE